MTRQASHHVQSHGALDLFTLFQGSFAEELFFSPSHGYFFSPFLYLFSTLQSREEGIKA